MIGLSLVVLSGIARADNSECPLPQIALASSYATVEADYSREIVNELIAAAQHDAGRARMDRLSIGAEIAVLGANSNSREVSVEVLSLAIRLRQLDCTVWSGRGALTLYGSFLRDARTLLEQLGGKEQALAPAMGEFHLPPPAPVVPDKPESPRSRSRGYYLSGGIVLGVGLALTAGALALSVDVARYRPAPACDASSSLCFNDIFAGLRPFAIGADVTLWVLGVASTVTGAVLLQKGGRWAEKARLLPEVAVGPNGGFLGAHLRF